MADFNADKGSGNGSVKPVYIKAGGANLTAIFPTQYNRKSHCALLGSPSEKGVKQYDNKVIQPSTIQMTGIVKYTDWGSLAVLRDQVRYHSLQKILCTFYGKSGSAERMIIESVEEIGESNRYDGVEVRITMTEFLEHSVVK